MDAFGASTAKSWVVDEHEARKRMLAIAKKLGIALDAVPGAKGGGAAQLTSTPKGGACAVARRLVVATLAALEAALLTAKVDDPIAVLVITWDVWTGWCLEPESQDMFCLSSGVGREKFLTSL